MINSFKYVFVETESSWFIGSFHHSLSFSSDGTTITGSTRATRSIDHYCNFEEDQVQFWETATGTATWSFERSSFVVFSPTDPKIAALFRSGSIHMVKRDSFGGKTWAGQTKHNHSNPGAVCIFNSDGKTIVMSSYKNEKCFREYDPTTPDWSHLKMKKVGNSITSVVCCPIKPGLFVFGDDRGEFEIVSNTGTDKYNLKSLCRLIPINPVRVSACAWSQDGKWIATGNDDGEIFLWNASVPTRTSFAMQLPRNRSNTTSKPTTSNISGKPLATTSLVFVPDNTALIIISGGYLSVWDMGKVGYVANSGLPDMATNMVLDGPRNRLAVVVNERITIYELKLPEEMCQMDGKSFIPSQLAEFDITDAIEDFDHRFSGLYFDIYRGAWKLDTPRIFQVIVAIKVFRFEQEEIEDRLIKFLTTWAGLSHDNLVPFLGVSTDFDGFPAVITSWMTNGSLSEYIRTEEEYDKMELVIGVARGVAYLHSANIVHSDIRGSSILVDDFGQARLADPGLLCVLANRLEVVSLSGTMNFYRWMAPELLKNSLAKATFATDVYSVTMTSLEIFTAEDPFEDVPDNFMVLVAQSIRPDRPDDVDDNLWSLWGEGWNQDPAMRPNMENYVERLAQLV